MRRTAIAWYLAASLGACYVGPQGAPAVSYSAPTADQNLKVPITTRSEEARSLYLRGRALTEQLRAHEGHALFQQAIAEDPTFALAEYSLAATAPNRREFFQHLLAAVGLVDQASRGERLLILSLQAGANADPTRARQYAESLSAAYPQDERAHWLLGNAYFARQQYDRAISEYRRAIKINPHYSPAFNSLGYAYRPSGRTAEAEKAFLDYIALVPNDPNPYDSYAELLMKVGRFHASILEYQKALEIDPHFGGSYVGIASNYMFSGRPDSAIAEARRYYNGARDDGERRTALFSEALTYVNEGATDQALLTMDRSYGIARALGDTASMSADLVAAADILLDAGRVDAAQARYQLARDLVAASSLSADVRQDNDLAAHYNAARVAIAAHDSVKARMEATIYLTGAEARGNDVRVRQAHELNGLLFLEQKRFDGSLHELGQADQQNPAVLDAMARAYRGKGDIARADDLASRALNMYTLPALPYAFLRARAKHVL